MRSNGTSEINAKTSSRSRYRFGLCVCLAPSASRKAKIGKAMRPICVSMAHCGRSVAHRWSHSIRSIASTWSDADEISGKLCRAEESLILNLSSNLICYPVDIHYIMNLRIYRSDEFKEIWYTCSEIISAGRIHLYLALFLHRDYCGQPDSSLSCSFSPQGLFRPAGCFSSLKTHLPGHFVNFRLVLL